MEKDDAKFRFSYVLGLISFIFVVVFTWGLWYLLMHPNGVLKLYTPMYGFSLAVVFLSAIVLISQVLGYFPLRDPLAAGSNRVIAGLMLSALAFLLTLVTTYWIFWGLIGKFGVAYFSPQSIVASGGTGAEPLVARENASTAITYFCSAFLWWALSWKAGFGNWPWLNTGRGTLAWSRFCTVIFFTVITYAILFHPHVCYLFYPPQNKAGVEPWWSSFAGTGSAFFSLGLLLCALAWVVITEVLWEGYPWKALKRNSEGTFLSGFTSVIGNFILGAITFVVMLRVMTFFWMEPFEGGQYTDAPYFRYIHTGELSGFVILAAFIVSTYFNNVFQRGSLLLRASMRFIAVVIGAYIIRAIYYSWVSTITLGRVPGMGQPDDTPLVWTILLLSIIMIHADFFQQWPMKTIEK